jgi:uncharacterized membrane protein
MNNLVVSVFPDEATADEGLRGLEELHRDGTVTAYATAVIERAGSGDLSVKRHDRGGPLADLLRKGLAGELIEAVQRELPPGTSALVAEVSDDSLDTMAARMEALGGKVTHDRLTDFLSGLIEEDTAETRADVADVSAEHAGRKAEAMDTVLDFDLQNAKEKLHRAAEKAGERLDRIKQEIEAKLAVLHDQAAKARPDVRDQIERRIRDLRTDLEQREARLREAYELAHEALS